MSIYRKYCIYIKSIYRNAKAIGLEKGELKRVKLSIQISILSFFGLVIFSILDGLQGKIPNMTVDIVGVGVYFYILVLFGKGFFKTGKILIIVYADLLLLFNASKEGPLAGNQFIFFPVMIGSLIIFSRREFLYSLLLWIFSLGCFIFLESTNYSYSLYPDMNPSLVHVNYFFCFFTGQILIIIFIINLISINTRSEKKLESLIKILSERNNNLKKINNELDSFVYKASHDLRSPLTSLMGLIELIKNEKDIETIKYYIKLEERTVNKLDSYIVDILNISRNSRLDLKPELVNLRDMLESLFHSLNYFENALRIKKEIHIDGHEFYTDRMRLTIVMNNLISNAIRYSDPNKKEQIIKISSVADDKICTISIWDNGLGIPYEHLDKVYNMFYRATDKKTGSGLGLYIVKETIEKMSGTIHVNSEPGEWTEFILHLPNWKSSDKH